MKTGVKKARAQAVPLALVPPAAAPEATVTLSLSPRDRWFAAQALFNAPWSGGEEIVLGLNAIHETLRLEEVPIDKRVDQLGKSAVSYVLTVRNADLLIRVMCGALGTGFKGIAGPMLAKLVIRLRALIRKATPAPTTPPAEGK